MATSIVQQYINYIKTHSTFQQIAKIEFLRADESSYGVFTTDVLDGNISAVRENGMRRTCNLTLSNIDGRYIPDPQGNNWINQKFRLSVGIRTDEDEELLFPQGVFYLKYPELKSSPTDSTIKLVGVDKFGWLNGKVGGRLDATYIIPRGTEPAQAIYDTLKLEDIQDPAKPIFNKPILQAALDPTPYTINTKSNNTYGDALLTINNMLSRNMYYNTNGNLVWEDDRNDDEKAVIFDFDQSVNHYLGSKYTPKYQDVYNTIKVIGDNVKGDIFSALRQNINLSSDSSVARIGKKVAKEINDPVIYSDELADIRAIYELKRATALTSKCTLTCFPLYHLDVDNVITYSDSNLGFDHERFVIIGIKIPLSPTKPMTLSLVRTIELFQGEFIPTEIPLLSSFTPPDNSTNIKAAGLDLTMTFDQNVVSGNGDIYVYKTSDDSLIETISASAVIINGALATISLVTDLGYNTGYYILVDSNAFKNDGDLYYTGITDKTVWNFTTEEEVLISSLDPTDDETNVKLSDDLTINFNQNIYGGDGYLKLYQDVDNLISNPQFDDGTTNWISEHTDVLNASAGIMSVIGGGVNINPHIYQSRVENAIVGHEYYMKTRLRVTNTDCRSIRNYIGGASTTLQTFPNVNEWYTVSNILTAISTTNIFVIYHYYIDASTASGKVMEIDGTGNNEVLVVDLTEMYGAGNEPSLSEADTIFGGEIGKALKDKFQGSALSIAGAIVTINPTSNLVYNTEYYVEIDSDTFKNVNDTYFAGIADKTTWNFTSELEMLITTLDPLDGAVDVPIADDLTITFNQDIIGATGKVKIFDSTDTLFEEFTASGLTIVGGVVTVNPSTDFDGLTDYYVQIEATAFYNVHNQFFVGISDKVTWNFTTAAAEYLGTMRTFFAVPGISTQDRLKLRPDTDTTDIEIRRKTSAWTSGDTISTGTLVGTIATYASGTTYSIGDWVIYSGECYICIQAGTGQQPDTSTTYWTDASDINNNIWYDAVSLINGTRYYFKAFPGKDSVYNETIGQDESSAKGGGLAHEYTVDSISGSDVEDTAGSEDGTASNVTYVSGKIGDAGSFNGSNSDIDLGAPADFNRTVKSANGCAYEVWVRIRTWGSSSAIKQILTDGNGWDAYIESDGSGQITAGKWIGSARAISKTGLSLNTWYHLILNMNAAHQVEFFVTAVLIGTNSDTTLPNNGSSVIMIGDYPTITRDLNGDIDQTRTYIRPLETYEITNLYNNGDGC